MQISSVLSEEISSPLWKFTGCPSSISFVHRGSMHQSAVHHRRLLLSRSFDILVMTCDQPSGVDTWLLQ